MVNPEDEIIGNYHWEFVESSVSDASIFQKNTMAQQTKLIMLVKKIVNPKYENGSLFINEED